ncbi:DUF429 domain-containing protein [Magnetococcus sp. PR-3]|uniref:DUF429 domain-containing protein n=1 Tax=Magnetococcus sp. PR-3 TaxID=3120355 RepID=UPI002FCE484A
MKPSERLILGVDCATQWARMSVAVGHWNNTRLTLQQTLTASDLNDDNWQKLVDQLSHLQTPLILAMDAPLGWPFPFMNQLFHHQAGEPLQGSANDLLRRMTDKVVRQHLGKTPLDVAADRIARTAHEALRMIGLIRSSHPEVAMLWHPAETPKIGLLETYPAAVIRQRGYASQGYKKEDAHAKQTRLQMVKAVAEEIDMPAHLHTVMSQTDHDLDALLCLLATKDFLQGKALPPPKDHLAQIKKEGWIWFQP